MGLTLSSESQDSGCWMHAQIDTPSDATSSDTVAVDMTCLNDLYEAYYTNAEDSSGQCNAGYYRYYVILLKLPNLFFSNFN